MYKYLLCWRYLRTRYMALASIISVMLGVATLIVVNTVMAGFSTKLQGPAARRARRRGGRGVRLDGFYDSDEQDGADPQRPVARASTSRRWRRRWKSSPCSSSASGGEADRPSRSSSSASTRRPDRRSAASPSSCYDSRTRPTPSFELTRPAIASADAWTATRRRPLPAGPAPPPPPAPNEPPPPSRRRSRAGPPEGVIVGYAIASYRIREPSRTTGQGQCASCRPGDDVSSSPPSAGSSSDAGLRPASRSCGYFKTRDERVRLATTSSCRSSTCSNLRTMEGRVDQHPDQAQGLRRGTPEVVDAPAGDCSATHVPGRRPGSRSRARCWRPSRSSRAS